MAPLRRPRGVAVTVSVDELEQWRQSHARLERTTAMLRVYQKGGQSTVSIEDMLDLLGQDPEAHAAPEARRTAPRDPREDPFTGIMWAGPPGSSPPGR